MFEYQHVEVDEVAFRDDAFCEEIGRPHCLRMDRQELMPSSRSALWHRIFAVLFDDTLDRLPTDLPDPEFSQFAENSRVSETRFLRDSQHEFPKMLTFRAVCSRLLLQTFRFAHPAIERLGGDDRDQFLNRSSQRFAELEQPRTFFKPCVHPLRQPRPKDAVLLFQVLSVIRQLVIRSAGDHCEKTMKQPAHLGPIPNWRISLSRQGVTLFCTAPKAVLEVPFAVPAKHLPDSKPPSPDYS